jgi:diguanylate cyclase (GGDEF)-like protein
MHGHFSPHEAATAPVGISWAFGTDRATKTARVVRRAMVRWFLVLTAPSLVLTAAFAQHVGGDVVWDLVLGLIGCGLIILFATLGLWKVLGLVDQLDEERHGLRQAYDQARLDALRDGLTGMGNHRAFQEEVTAFVTEARTADRPFALLFIDLDDLKKTNDQHGHGAGDELLRTAARIITANMRRADRGFRVGGDEFAVLLAECTADQALLIGRRILASALEGSAGTSRSGPFSVTIGVSAYPTPAADRLMLIHQADAAMYWGKRHGRTDVQVYDPTRHGMAEDQRPHDELAAAVSRVAAGHLLTPVYQPIYSLRTGQVVGYEGLVRPLPNAGFDNASALFVAAESTGRTVELDFASLEAVLAGARTLDDRLYLSVNLSPRSLETEAFSPFELLSLARRHGIDPTRLVVELTEREAIEDLGRVRSALGALRRHGVRTAADDVGAGNAGLRLLSELHFDVMKIDLSLVQAGAARESADAVLHALRDLARRSGQSVVAEGVETPGQLVEVMALGFESAQGYLLRRPLPTLDAGPLDLAALADLADTAA